MPIRQYAKYRRGWLQRSATKITSHNRGLPACRQNRASNCQHATGTLHRNQGEPERLGLAIQGREPIPN